MWQIREGSDTLAMEIFHNCYKSNVKVHIGRSASTHRHIFIFTFRFPTVILIIFCFVTLSKEIQAKLWHIHILLHYICDFIFTAPLIIWSYWRSFELSTRSLIMVQSAKNYDNFHTLRFINVFLSSFRFFVWTKVNLIFRHV